VEISFNTKTRLPGPGRLISTFIDQNPKIIFYEYVEDGCSASLSIALEKQT
jgi:hypothetical protein